LTQKVQDIFIWWASWEILLRFSAPSVWVWRWWITGGIVGALVIVEVTFIAYTLLKEKRDTSNDTSVQPSHNGAVLAATGDLEQPLMVDENLWYVCVIG
jgi:hypothetical protein